MQACRDALADCASALADLPGLHVVVGHPHQFADRADVRTRSHAVQRRHNAASVLIVRGGNVGLATATPSQTATIGTLAASGTGVQNLGGGDITLEAKGTVRTITVNEAISATSGQITLTATGSDFSNDRQDQIF
jgi:hypothetical protein